MGGGTTTFGALKELQSYLRDNSEEADARLRFCPLLEDPVFGGLFAAAGTAGMSNKWIDAPEGVLGYFVSMSDDQLARLASHASEELKAEIRKMLQSKAMRFKDGKTIVELVVEAVATHSPTKRSLSGASNLAFEMNSVLRQWLHPDAIPDLLDGLNEENARIRWCVAFALGFLGPGRAIPGLVRALADREEDVRRRASVSLLGICTGKPTDEARETLVSALENPDPYVRSCVIKAIAGLEFPGAAELVPTLIAALSDPHKDVRSSAAAALPRITGKSFFFGSADSAKWQKWWEENRSSSSSGTSKEND